MRKQFTTHIATPAGPRFSTHGSEEEMRQSLIEYYNEVHAPESDEGDLPEDADLQTVKDAIEEIEDVSWEETLLPPQKVWVLVVDDHSGGTSIDLHTSRRDALESLAVTYDACLALLDDDAASQLLSTHLDENHNASWFVLEEKEIPA